MDSVDLRAPECYPHPVGRIEVLETHISRVFLTGDLAYKLKKPVNLGFLDFSTLEARHFYCEEEVRLNRRTAPAIYLGVVPVTASEGGARIGGRGRVVDYAVKMRQFSQDALLERMARAHAVEPRHVDTLADTLAAFHGAAGRTTRFGSAARILACVLDNLDALEIEGGPVDWLRRWTRNEHGRLLPAFAERRAGGAVRECHGDLHLANVVCIDGHPMPFDCIEFSEELRWIDVMSDLAFLTMDLAGHGLAPLAHRLLDRYLSATGDYGGLRVLRFYEVFRALVRAKVARLRQSQCPPGSRAAAAARAECSRRIELACGLAVAGVPALVLMHGLSGSGKTTVSQQVVERFGAVRVRSDVERKRLHGMAALAARAAMP